MKLILTQEVTGLGGSGDVVDVKPGYGRNYLIPRGYATPWTAGGQKQVDALQRAREARAVRDEEHAQELKQKLEAAPINVRAQAGPAGRLFGSVTPAMIADAAGETVGEPVDKRTIAIDAAIKQTGAHAVQVRLDEDVVADVALNVTPA